MNLWEKQNQEEIKKRIENHLVHCDVCSRASGDPLRYCRDGKNLAARLALRTMYDSYYATYTQFGHHPKRARQEARQQTNIAYVREALAQWGALEEDDRREVVLRFMDVTVSNVRMAGEDGDDGDGDGEEKVA